MQHRKWISATELSRWADTVDFRSRLPELLRRLIHATTEQSDLKSIEFLGGEEAQRPGFDGRTETGSGNAWVPTGLAVWEAGSDRDVLRKVNQDFEKRSNAPPDGKGTTYIAVTPRDFIKKREWVEEKSKLGVWREVRVYDSNDLEQWLEANPSVALWLLSTMGGRSEGVVDLSTHWANLVNSLTRPVPPECLLVSRSNIAKAFKEWLDHPPALLSVRAESPQEVLDVFSAWTASLTEAERTSISSRAVIVEQLDSWRQMVNSGARLILLRAEQLELSQELLSEAVRKKHHVLVPVSSLSLDVGSGPRLVRMNRYELEEVLKKANFSEQESHAFAQHSGGTFSVLKRQLSNVPAVKVPAWATPEAAADLAPLLLAGAWKDSSPADQATVSKIAGRTYQRVIVTLNRWRATPDSPVRWANGEWAFVSPQDAWTFLAKGLTPGHLSAFEESAVAVLGLDDPRFDLDREDRWLAGIHGKLPPHSNALRHGLAQTLALLATRDTGNAIPDCIPTKARVSRTIAAVLQNGGWRRWASLGDLLSVLAEASPESVLDAADAGLEGSDPELPKLFREEGKGFSGRAEHTGVLWALERLAWAPEYLARVAIILARLAETDPGGQWANRPDASLRDTFCPWLPHTAAHLDQRLEIVKLVLDRFPAVGWKLLLKLLPEQMSAIPSRALPEWRFWAERWRRGVTRAEYAKIAMAHISMAISATEQSPERWLDLIDHFGQFPEAERTRAIEAMERSAAMTLSNELRLKIWLGLREQIQRHKYFSKAKWAMTTDTLGRLEKTAEAFRPTDPVERVLPLFQEGFSFHRLGNQDMPWAKQEELAQAERARAVSDLVAAEGLPGVQHLSRLAGQAWAVGFALADVWSTTNDAAILPALLCCGDKALEEFSRGYAGRRTGRSGWDWVKALPLKEWRPQEAAALLTLAPFERPTWDYVEGLGAAVSAEFWKSVRHYFEGGEDDIKYAVKKLIGAGRAGAALDVVGMAAIGKTRIPTSVLLDLFEEGLTALGSDSSRPISADMIEEILSRLQKAQDVDEVRLANLEWLLLPALHGRAAPSALQAVLARDPSFFVHMLALHFRPKHLDKTADSPADKQQAAQAERAAALLRDWRRIPGTKPDGGIDAGQLMTWVAEARKEAAALDRIEVCDIMLGKVLAFAPEDADGSWPCTPVRDLLEEVASKDLDQGVHTGVINKRGLVSKSIEEGGRQEREIAARYERYAVKAQTRWPRVATLLRRVANSYMAEADRADAEVEAER